MGRARTKTAWRFAWHRAVLPSHLSAPSEPPTEEQGSRRQLAPEMAARFELPAAGLPLVWVGLEVFAVEQVGLLLMRVEMEAFAVVGRVA